jgi:hypothetical protein
MANMTQEQKELLLKDLCSRLPYGVKISVNDKIETLQGINILDNVVEYGTFLSSDIEEVKPYLLPLSSMTEEQKKEYNRRKHDIQLVDEEGVIVKEVGLFDSPESFEYLIENHFDCHGLISIGLANDATNLNIY